MDQILDSVQVMLVAQTFVTLFLIFVFWSFSGLLRRHAFYRWWTWAWTCFGVFLAAGKIALSITANPSSRMAFILIAEIAAYVQAPLLAFGALSFVSDDTFHTSARKRNITMFGAAALALLAFAVSQLFAAERMVAYTIRSGPRYLLIMAVFLGCGYIFVRRGLQLRSKASLVLGIACGLWGVQQVEYACAAASDLFARFVHHVPMQATGSSVAWFGVDLIGEIGIAAAMILFLLEEHRRTEAAVHYWESHSRDLLNNANDAIYTHDLEGNYTSVNQAAIALTGYSRNELLQMNMRELVLAEDLHGVREALERKISKGEKSGVPFGVRLRRKDGSVCHVEVSTRLMEQDGEIFGVQGIARDISARKKVEHELILQTGYLEQLFEGAPEAVAILDSDHIVQRVNKEFTTMFGFSAPEAVGADLCDLIIPPELKEESRNKDDEIRLGARATWETVRMRKDGRRLNVSVTGMPIKAGDNQIAVYAMYRDITAETKARALQSALYEIAETTSSASDLDALYAAIHKILEKLMYAKNCYIALHDRTTDVVSFPYFHDEMEHCPPPRRFGNGLTEYVLSTGQPLLATKEVLEEIAATGKVSRMGPKSLDWMGVPLKTAEHTFGVLVLQSYEPDVRYNHQDEELLIFVSHQIASAIERKQAEQALVESESKFRAVAETAVPAIYIYDGKKFLYVNPAAVRLFGRPKEELLTMDPWSLVHPDFKAKSQKLAEERLKGNEVASRYELKVTTANGSFRWVDLSTGLIQFEGQSAVLGTAIDITERKRSEQLQAALYRISEQASGADDLHEFYKAIHSTVAELMYADNFYIAFYDADKDLINFPYVVDTVDANFPTRKPGRGLTEYVLRTGQPLLASPEVFERMTESGDVEAVGADCLDWLGVPLAKGDKVFGVLAVQTYKEHVRFTDEHKEILTFVSQQVASASEHKRNQERIKESEERYRSLIDGATYGIYRADEYGFLSANPALVKMLGYESEKELKSLNIATDVYWDPAERERMIARYRTNDYTEGVETTWKRKDGAPVTVRLSGRIIKDASGDVKVFEGIVENVTERRALEDQLRQAQKMEAIGRLAGGVAHDFNNLLTVIKGYSELLVDKVSDNDSAHQDVVEIRRAADRAAGLTGQLLAFSRQQVLAPKVLDLNDVVANMDKLFRRLLGEDVELFTHLGSHLGRVKADPGQIEQVIMNLAVNARDAMPRGGKLIIETSNATLQADEVHDGTSIIAGSYVVLAVTDTGTGIDKQTRNRIFDPFFTTKEQGKGTGLGLSTVYGIVQQSEGHITVWSELGVGTTFRIWLPRVDRAADASALRAENAPEKGNEVILVVEDEDGVRSLVKHILQKHGYKVLLASEGSEALEVAEAHSGRIDLLLTDVVLKHMSGRELAQKLMSARTGLRVLFMSGYTDDAILHHGVLEASTAFLQKPFTTDSLSRKVREVLDAPVVKGARAGE